MEVVLEKVSKTIDYHRAVVEVDLEFQSAGVNVIIGPNGAGKTTLLRIVGLLEKPDRGEVFYNNCSSARLRLREKTDLRQKIGFVFQAPLLLEGSVWRNLTYGLHIRKRAVDIEHIKEVLREVWLKNKIQLEAKKLSGGEKQRLQLARVMLLEPDLYLLDEPTANLDPLSSRNIEAMITEIARNGKTVVFTTHNLVQARLLGQKFFFLEAGRLVQQGSAAEIFHRPVSLDIAEFASAENIIHGEIICAGESRFLQANGLRIQVVTPLTGGRAAGVIRAEDILLSTAPIGSSARNSFKGSIFAIDEIGFILSVSVRCQNQVFISFITRESALLMDLQVGQEVYATFKSTAVHLIKL
jgi:molybdopterin-binding protein